MLLAGAGTSLGTKAGNPWHGTWTEDGLALPNETTMAIPVAVGGGPSGWPDFYPIAEPGLTQWGPRHGDCLLVRVPDVPVPDASEDEQALGMTWLNHALISGANRLLYGLPIGPSKWVYLDADDSPWLAEMRQVYTGQPFYRFRFSSRFVFGESMDAVLFDSGGDAVTGHSLVVFDASETGRSVAVGLHRYSETAGHELFPVPARLVLSGTPGVDFDVAEEVAATSLSDPDHVWGYGEPWAGNAYPAGHWSGVELLPPYWIFDGDDEISLRFGVDYDASAWPLVENETVHVDRTLAGTLSVVTSFGSFDIEFSNTISETSYGNFAASFAIGDWSYSHAIASADDAGVVPFVYTVRQTNKVIEVVFSDHHIAADELDTEVFSICRVLPDRFEATGVITTLDEIPKFMTYHPVTWELLESNEPVCFM